MKKFPIICPTGTRVVVKQGFRPIDNPSHDAIDFVIWNDSLSERENKRLTYGAQLVAPVNSTCVKVDNYGFMNEKGNGCDIEWFEDGYYWRLHFWHNASNSINFNDLVKEGQIVGFMGNNGFVIPTPTPFTPYNGTHCHCRFSRYKKNAYGGNTEIVSLDMLDYFDIHTPYSGEDSSVFIDLEPVKWAWFKLGIVDNFGRLVYFIKYIFNNK